MYQCILLWSIWEEGLCNHTITDKQLQTLNIYIRIAHILRHSFLFLHLIVPRYSLARITRSRPVPSRVISLCITQRVYTFF